MKRVGYEFLLTTKPGIEERDFKMAKNFVRISVEDSFKAGDIQKIQKQFSEAGAGLGAHFASIKLDESSGQNQPVLCARISGNPTINQKTWIAKHAL